MGFQNNVLSGAGGSGTAVHTIDQSIRYNDDDSPILKKTYSSAGTEETFTFSCWVKRGNIGSGLGGAGSYGVTLFSGGPDVSNYGEIVFRSSGYGVVDSLDFYYSKSGSISADLVTSRLFRDPSAWYHIVCVMDTTNAIQTERMRIYVNGSRVTDFSTETYPSKDAVPDFNTASEHGIGGFAVSTDTRFFDGYLAEIVFLDGTATDCNSFAEFNSSGLWVPKSVSGLTFGTNGFHIDGRDSSDLGDDESGQGNDYTASGLSSDDQQPDSPTNNHAVFNRLDVAPNGFTTFSEGNLAIIYSGASARELARSSITIPANTDGFFEVKITVTLGSGVDFALGIEDGSALQDASNTTYTNAYVIREDGTFSTSGSSGTASYGTSFTNNDVIGVWRKANGDLVFYKNGTAMNSGTPAVTGVTGEMHFVAGGFNGGAGIGRFASSQWTNKPSGVTDSMALNTSNLGS